jgi:uncharacterized protein YyaL (SSP411 family)
MLDLYEVTGDPSLLRQARDLAALLAAQHFDADGGGFWDVRKSGSGPGRLQERQKSVQENAAVSMLFVRLSHLTREPRYEEILRCTLESFVALYPQMGYFASGYALAADALLHPSLAINIVGTLPAASDLHQAALSLRSPVRLVQVIDPETASGLLTDLDLPADPSPAAYVCAGTACAPPARDVDQMLEAIRQLRWSAAEPAG